MKQNKRILFFILTVLGFSLLECLLTALLSPLVTESLFVSRVFPYFTRLLAVIPPFLALGAATEAIRVRGLGYATLYIGIYAAHSLLAQIPLSLIVYTESYSAPYGTVLFSHMLSATVTALLFFLFLLLGYAVFMQSERVSEDTPIFSCRGRDARVILLASAILTLYHGLRELIDFFVYLRDKLYIVSGEDLLSILFSICFFLALGVFCFFTGRLSERFFPTLPPEEITGEDDFI